MEIHIESSVWLLEKFPAEFLEDFSVILFEEFPEEFSVGLWEQFLDKFPVEFLEVYPAGTTQQFQK